MTTSAHPYRLGIICCLPAAYDAQGRLVCNHSIGRLLDVMRAMVPGARLCIPVLPEPQSQMNHVLSFAPDEVTAMPPLKSVARSQTYFFQTRRIVRQFASTVDVLFVRLPFQIPLAVAGLGKPKLMHVVGNTHQVIAASSDYKGMVKKLALRFAAHSNATIRRMAHEPMTRVATNGGEMWDFLGCRDGRVVVSSCI